MLKAAPENFRPNMLFSRVRAGFSTLLGTCPRIKAVPPLGKRAGSKKGIQTPVIVKSST